MLGFNPHCHGFSPIKAELLASWRDDTRQQVNNLPDRIACCRFERFVKPLFVRLCVGEEKTTFGRVAACSGKFFTKFIVHDVDGCVKVDFNSVCVLDRGHGFFPFCLKDDKDDKDEGDEEEEEDEETDPINKNNPDDDDEDK